MINILYLVFAYLLGSIPFGFLITHFSTKKNILKIGWEKTSGSNVFKNIGKWQGILTGLLDAAKGFIAVWLAQKIGLSPEIQALSGVAAVCGHNWSCFLKFAGGRGIGTFLGAALVLSPEILGFSLIPLIVLTLVWNASIGTILLLITALLLSIYFGQLESMGIFTIVCLLPIFIKRLSPLKDISFKNRALIKNRLIFDNNQPCLELRIKRIFNRLTRE